MIAALLDPALRSIALAIVAGLGLKMLRLQNPHIQLTVWTFVLAASLLMPAATRLASALAPPAPILAPVEAFPGLLDLEPGSRSDGALATSFDFQDRPPKATDLGARMNFIATILYWGIAGFFLLRIAAGLLLTARLVRAAKPLNDRWVLGWDIRVSGDICTAATFGETILLPEDHVDWSAAKRCAVLAHEVEHARRGDFYVQIAAMINRAIFWYSPLSWWLQHRLSLLVEAVSDDAALTIVRDRPLYAEILLEFSRGRQVSLPAVSMARPATVRARIERVLAESSVPLKIGKRARAILISTTLLIAGIVSMPIAAPSSASRQGDAAGFEQPALKQMADLTLPAPDALRVAATIDNSAKILEVGAANFSEGPTTISSRRGHILETADGVVSSGVDSSVVVSAPRQRIAAIEPNGVDDAGRPAPLADPKLLRRLDGKAKARGSDLTPSRRVPAERQATPRLPTSIFRSFSSSIASICVDRSWTQGDPTGQHAFYVCRDQQSRSTDVTLTAEWPSNPFQLGAAADGASGPSICYDRRWTQGDPTEQRAFYVCSKSRSVAAADGVTGDVTAMFRAPSL
jgi:BlaR1 peptidase M56